MTLTLEFYFARRITPNEIEALFNGRPGLKTIITESAGELISSNTVRVIFEGDMELIKRTQQVFRELASSNWHVEEQLH